MILSGDPVRITAGGPQYPLVLSAGPWCWDVRVAGYVVTVQSNLREGTKIPQEEILDFAIEAIRVWEAKKVLAL